MKYDHRTDTFAGCWIRLSRSGMVVLDSDGDVEHRITESEYRRLDADDRCCDWSRSDGVTAKDADDEGSDQAWCLALLDQWGMTTRDVYEMYDCTLPGWLLNMDRETYRAERELEREERAQARADDEDAEIHAREEMETRAVERGETVTYCCAASVEEAADEIGMPAGSDTARLYYTRKIHRAEAMRRAAKISRRHEGTDYDHMLHRGIDRDTARDLIR